jgi:putative transposase
MLLVDARGVPLSIIVTAANHHDITQLVPTRDAVVIARPAVAPRARQHLCADAGFVGAAAKQDMLDRDYTPHVRPRHQNASNEPKASARGAGSSKSLTRGTRASANFWFATRRCIVLTSR